jgi:hypothetical protein
MLFLRPRLPLVQGLRAIPLETAAETDLWRCFDPDAVVVVVTQPPLESGDAFDDDDSAGLDDVPLLQLRIAPVHAAVASCFVTAERLDHFAPETFEVEPLPRSRDEVVHRDDLVAEGGCQHRLPGPAGAVDTDE